MDSNDVTGASYRLGLLIWALISAATMVVGLLWIDGQRVWACVCAAAPVLLYWKGGSLSRAVDRAFFCARDAWRVRRRRPGRLYCPECAEELAEGGQCPKCRGAWLTPDGLAALCKPVGRGAKDWKALDEEPDAAALCPRCAQPMEEGDLPSVPSAFSRCAACDGYWAPRVTRLWFEVGVPGGRG